MCSFYSALLMSSYFVDWGLQKLDELADQDLRRKKQLQAARLEVPHFLGREVSHVHYKSSITRLLTEDIDVPEDQNDDILDLVSRVEMALESLKL